MWKAKRPSATPPSPIVAGSPCEPYGSAARYVRMVASVALTDQERVGSPCPRSARARTAGQIAKRGGVAESVGEASRVRANGGAGASSLRTDADSPPRPRAIGPHRPAQWAA